MNQDRLKSIIAKKAKGNSTLSAQLYQMYFFEHLLERISKSKYKHNIILKGGLLLSSVIGDDERTTKDMDATLKSLPLEKDNVIEIINDIVNIKIDDGIQFKIENVKDIRLESEYGGFKINLLATMDNLKVYLAVELTTGDKITPREIQYMYNSHFEDKKIPILAYTLETLIAEKYQTIIDRDIYNTRMKDFYDIYVLINDNKEKINFKNLILAIQNTFKNRKTELNIENIKEQLENMKTSEQLIKLWKSYQITAPYANRIDFDLLFESLYFITDLLKED